MNRQSREDRPVAYGAVYFRRSSPPRRDWERDYEQAAKDGMNSFRHWFSWSAIEIAPGVYDWEPYDRQLELAAKYGIDTVIAEMSDHAPEWFYAKHPEAYRENVRGEKRRNPMNSSAVIGGAHTMCMDNGAVREATLGFLTALGEHYKDMPGMFGYDVWNECSLYTPDNLCYCPSTQALFREWVKEKYGGDLAALNKAWFRFSYTDWEQVQLPRFVGPYPEFFDALYFYGDIQQKWFDLRVETLRKADPNHKLLSHGNGKSHSDMANCCGDDWRYSGSVDIFGYTFWYANNCNTVMGGDIIRSAAKGKEFWRAEALGDNNWDRRSDATPYRAEMDAMHDPANIRFDAAQSFVSGATGFINPRWRGLLEGDLFHAFGWYAPDGSPTERSEVAGEIGRWANAPLTRPLWKAKPVKGQAALLMTPEAQMINYAVHKSTDTYASCLKGAFQAFYDSGIQSDCIKPHQLKDYDFVYLPMTLSLTDGQAEQLRSWVERGGVLVSEAAPGYFDDKGHAIEWQPNRGLEELFGCRQKEVHLGPDANTELDLVSGRGVIHAGCYRQSFTLTTGMATGYHPDGSPAVVVNTYGKGRAMLVGSCPGYGYHKRPDEATRRWFASLMEFAGKKPVLRAPYNTGVGLRAWQNGSETYLWILNATERGQTVTVEVSPELISVTESEVIRGGEASFSGGTVTARVQGKDVSVIRISK